MCLILALPNVRLVELKALVPLTDTITILCDLVSATLLFVQARVFRSRALTILAGAFVTTALLSLAHMLVFPGTFAPTGLLGAGLSTAPWIMTLARAAVPVAVILYVVVRAREEASPADLHASAPGVARAVIVAACLTGGVILLTTVGQDLLPAIFVDRYRFARANHIAINLALMPLVAAALIVLYRRRKSVLDMWLLVVLTALMTQIPVNAAGWARYTAGSYAHYLLMLAWHLILVLALVAESSRLYMRLAMSIAAEKRERNARLMTVDAAVSAISHEVRQPLAAITTNAAAGLAWLERDAPDLERAAHSLRSNGEQAQRCSELIGSIRSLLVKRTGERTTIRLNELVRETVRLLERELRGTRVLLQLALHEPLPAIAGNRGQLQQVLVNLLTNAIDSLSAIHGRARLIVIRSRKLDGGNVLLELSDTGDGIPPEKMDEIFEPFFTTKATGTGLGLSLSQTIVEEHGGRLWASPSEPQGAVFHLQFPQQDPAGELAQRVG